MTSKKPVKQIDFQFALCIDWETSGADFGKDSSLTYQGLSFGAIVFNAKTLEPIEKMYVEIKFDETKWTWTEGAARIHGLTREYLDANGITQEDAAIKLAELILRYWGTDSKVLFLGHNPEFDRRFTNQLLNQIGIEFSVEPSGTFESRIEVFHVVLDTSALGFIAFGLYKSDLLFAKIGFEERGDHNSMTDAEMTLMTCKAVRELVSAGLNGLPVEAGING
jgi:DNA polymerase III epsilon subunit-like protein